MLQKQQGNFFQYQPSSDIIISFSFNAFIYSDCFFDLAITDFFGVFINCLKLLILDLLFQNFFHR